jgi:hypothetical protein
MKQEVVQENVWLENESCYFQNLSQKDSKIQGTSSTILFLDRSLFSVLSN